MLAFKLSEGSDNNDPILVMMVETGTAVDMLDAFLMRRHQMKLPTITDPKEKSKLQQEYLLERRKRLYGGT